MNGGIPMNTQKTVANTNKIRPTTTKTIENTNKMKEDTMKTVENTNKKTYWTLKTIDNTNKIWALVEKTIVYPTKNEQIRQFYKLYSNIFGMNDEKLIDLAGKYGTFSKKTVDNTNKIGAIVQKNKASAAKTAMVAPKNIVKSMQFDGSIKKLLGKSIKIEGIVAKTPIKSIFFNGSEYSIPVYLQSKYNIFPRKFKKTLYQRQNLPKLPKSPAKNPIEFNKYIDSIHAIDSTMKRFYTMVGIQNPRIYNAIQPLNHKMRNDIYAVYTICNIALKNAIKRKISNEPTNNGIELLYSVKSSLTAGFVMLYGNSEYFAMNNTYPISSDLIQYVMQVYFEHGPYYKLNKNGDIEYQIDKFKYVFRQIDKFLRAMRTTSSMATSFEKNQNEKIQNQIISDKEDFKIFQNDNSDNALSIEDYKALCNFNATELQIIDLLAIGHKINKINDILGFTNRMKLYRVMKKIAKKMQVAKIAFENN